MYAVTSSATRTRTTIAAITMYPLDPTSGKLPRTESRMRFLCLRYVLQRAGSRILLTWRSSSEMDQIDAWPLGAIRYGARVIPGFRSARAPFLLAVAVLGVGRGKKSQSTHNRAK